MVVHTLNSTYTFVDKGDGAFEMTSTNERYAGPQLVSFLRPPSAGSGLFIKAPTPTRPHRVIITSEVLSIQP